MDQLPLEVEPGWDELFEQHGVEGTLVVHRIGGERLAVHNVDRSTMPAIPASTFKVLNSLIALETGVIEDVDEVIPWDGVERSFHAWNQDQTLRSAIEVSAVWAYQDLARRIGEQQMAKHVAATGYGNADIGGGIDEFWLRGDLRISPVEQVDVLTRLMENKLPFSDHHQRDVREILIRDRGDGWVFGHKTGTALSAEPVLGWLVGFTEYDDAVWVFALNLDLGHDATLDGQIDPQVRQQLARASLVQLGALPESALG